MNGRLLLGLLMIVLLPACGWPAAPSVTCADFSGYALGRLLASPFRRAGYQVTSLGKDPFIGHVWVGLHALQFDDAGLEIDLPEPSDSATLEVVSLTTVDLTLQALDAGAGVVTSTSVPADGEVHRVTLTGNAITRATVKGGGSEAYLVKICS